MKYFRNVVLFLHFYMVLNAQTNLVLNGSFENYTYCPNNAGQFQNNVLNWYNPNISSPDYFNSCCTTGCIGTDIPNTGFGFQNTQSGNGFVGIIPYQPYSSPANGREYVGSQLQSPLISGHNYYVEFYVNLADIVIYATSRLGAYFSNTQIFQNDYFYINVVPQVQNPLGNFLTDKTNWTKISGSFIANGGEQYIIIGNFFDDANTDSIQVSGNLSQNLPYYFIDDVSVIDSTAIGIAEQEKYNAKLHVFPNPANDEINIEFSEIKKGNILVTDLNGKIVMQESFEAKLLQLDVSTLEAGIYFVEAILENNKKLRQKIVVVR